jgi:hypothetical protein
MSSEAWAIVVATFLGPVLAVVITIWSSGRSEQKSRRMHVFRTLMATRKVGISPDHVMALNLIEVDFYKCKKVIEAWAKYKEHLFGDKPEDTAWHDERDMRLARLLYEIASVMSFRIPAIDIFKGGYAPSGWRHRDDRHSAFLEYFYDLSQNRKHFPLWVHGVTPPPGPVPPSSQQSGAPPVAQTAGP